MRMPPSSPLPPKDISGVGALSDLGWGADRAGQREMRTQENSEQRGT